MKGSLIACMIACLTSSSLLAQKQNASYELHMHRSPVPIRVDGLLDDAAWETAEVATNFFMVLPMDTSHTRVRTDVRMTYDSTNLYLIAVCYHAVPGPYIVESLRRDFNFGKNDNFLLFMDTFDDLTNGFSFGANAAGAQWDGTMYEGGKVDLSWDNKWRSVVTNYDDKWIFEMAVPFKTIRYKKGITRWGINFSRLDLKTTEKSSWTPIPRQFPTASLAYTGTLVWDEPPPQIGANISLIPYGLSRWSRNIEADGSVATKKVFGADAKIAVTSSLNMDLTVNPDFSQVDVDRQVTNLDRYELFFPERRQFFLENGDLFANFGYSNIRPFFSRRIGLNVPISYGGRLSGKINRNWRIGAMDMQTGAVDSLALPAQNFTVVAIQRRLFARSNVGILFVNKQSLHYEPPTDPDLPVYSGYNRNIGLEYNLASSDNRITGKALFLKSMSEGVSSKDETHAANIQYAGRKWNVAWQHQYVGKNFTAETGYVPRKGFINLSPSVARLFFPIGTKVLSHGPNANATLFYNDKFHATDNITTVGYSVTFRKLSTLSVTAARNFVQLLNPFDPTRSNKDSLATGSRHLWNAYSIGFVSRPQKVFTYGFTSSYGGYYQNGTLFTFTSDMGYRFQPYMSLTLSTSYNDIRLPEPWGKTTFWLISPRVDVTMTNKLFATAFVQYNEQRDNVNLNARLQWRYKPASDLFIVYTDNYLPGSFDVKNRAIVVKLTYWWNL